MIAEINYDTTREKRIRLCFKNSNKSINRNNYFSSSIINNNNYKTMKTQIITKLDILLSITPESNIYQMTLLNSIKQDLINEWNASDDYAQQIREVLDMDNTYELLSNIKIR